MKLLPILSVSILLTLHARAVTYYVNVANPAPAAPFTNWPTAATDIQSAIDAATNGDLILVTNGLYNTGGRVVYGSLTNRVVINKAVTVQSVNGPALTTIQGYQSAANSGSNNVRCVYMTNNVTLNGFTINGGATFHVGTDFSQLSGGGVFCESTNTILTNCILAGNFCETANSFGGGGGVYQGTLNNCILSNNSNLYYSAAGGGAKQSILNNCLILSNSASFGGGAAFSTLNNCTVIGNIAPFFASTACGGGTYECSANYCLIAGNISTTIGGGDCYGILNYCILSNNLCYLPPQSGNGGGGGGSFSSTLNNCLVISNYCYGDGGGVYFNGASPVLTNCTIVGNTATKQGGGVYMGSLANCIVYGNYCPSVYSYYSNIYNAKLTYCWTSDPLFVNPLVADYHLQSNSPCINAGNNAYVSTTNDLDGKPRIVGGTVDIGAYEYQSPVSVLSYVWAQQYGLPTDGTADYADTDGTGMNNWQKWIAGLNPTNPASVLAMLTPTATNNPAGVTVSWQSVNTRTYYLHRATNLTAQPAFTVIGSNIVGQAGTTSFTDTTATNAGSYFYRVGVQ